jgi:hypothetical protein
MFREVLEIARESGDRVGECPALLGLATVAMRRDQPLEAARVLSEASDAAATVGDRMMTGRVVLALAEAELADGVLEAAAGHFLAIRVFRCGASSRDLPTRSIVRGLL